MEKDLTYDYSTRSETEKSFLPLGYQGNVYVMSNNWIDIIKPSNEKIKILEIGAYHGSNICSLVKTYATHNSSEIHCIDPWFEYNEYNEYNGHQVTNYSIFLNNICKLSPNDLHKIYIHRGLSENIIPNFEDEAFDIIFVDGNHTKKFTLEDSVLSFKKLKKNGWLIIDDMQSSEVSLAAQTFCTIYDQYLIKASINGTQLFLQKK
jgi:hypothetical protein